MRCPSESRLLPEDQRKRCSNHDTGRVSDLQNAFKSQDESPEHRLTFRSHPKEKRSQEKSVTRHIQSEGGGTASANLSSFAAPRSIANPYFLSESLLILSRRSTKQPQRSSTGTYVLLLSCLFGCTNVQPDHARFINGKSACRRLRSS